MAVFVKNIYCEIKEFKHVFGDVYDIVFEYNGKTIPFNNMTVDVEFRQDINSSYSGLIEEKNNLLINCKSTKIHR